MCGKLIKNMLKHYLSMVSLLLWSDLYATLFAEGEL